MGRQVSLRHDREATTKPNGAPKVSFDRPYYGDRATARPFFSWDWRYADPGSEGYDVSYATNVDVDRDPDLLLKHKAFLSVGHDDTGPGRCATTSSARATTV